MLLFGRRIPVLAIHLGKFSLPRDCLSKSWMAPVSTFLFRFTTISDTAILHVSQVSRRSGCGLDGRSTGGNVVFDLPLFGVVLVG